MTFDAGWTPLLDELASCGSIRDTAGSHVALRWGGSSAPCEASLSDASLSWASVVLGHDGLPPP